MMGSDRQQDGVHIGHCGATAVEFVAKKLVIKGSDCCGEWGVVCVTKGNGGMMPQGGTDDGMKGILGSSHLTWLQLLRSSSVAVSTSQDFEDKAAITAFCVQWRKKNF